MLAKAQDASLAQQRAVAVISGQAPGSAPADKVCAGIPDMADGQVAAEPDRDCDSRAEPSPPTVPLPQGEVGGLQDSCEVSRPWAWAKETAKMPERLRSSAGVMVRSVCHGEDAVGDQHCVVTCTTRSPARHRC